eukprot:6800716-Lingulodinium_polyedra.AAC.1
MRVRREGKGMPRTERRARPTDRSGPKGGTGRKGAGRGGLSREQLKAISHCKRCGRKGHWREDCRERSPGPKETRPTAFVFLTGSDGGEAQVPQILENPAGPTLEVEEAVLLTVEPGEAVVDTAAGQSLIGARCLKALEERLQSLGLRTVSFDPDMSPAPRGIGGRATVIGARIIPVAIQGRPGFIEATVLAEDIP